MEAIEAVRSRGAVPLLVGGTMLYFKALREGLSALPAADPAVRAQLDARAAAEGWPALHAELARVDPVTAARLERTDAQRIQRALEVHAISGRPLSALQGARDAHGGIGPTIAVSLVPEDRALLHRVLAERFDAMLTAGLVGELEALRARYPLTPEMPSMRCVGYRQAWEYLDGRVGARDFRAKGIAATRQLAKRQFTWLRSTTAVAFEPWAPHLEERVATHLRQQGLSS
jgi:tRNA dimethylallyltransferase